MGHGLQLDGSTPRQPLINMGVVRNSDLAALLPIVNRSSRVLACIASNEPSVQTPCRKSESTWSTRQNGPTLELLQEIARIVSTRDRREGLPSVNLINNLLMSSLEDFQIILQCLE